MARVPFLSVKFDGQALDPLVRAVTVEDNDRLVDEATLTFDDPDGKGADLFAAGQDADRRARLGRASTPSSSRASSSTGTRSRAPTAKRSVTVVARDLSHRMSQKPVTGEFKPGTLETVVREVATRNNWTGDLATITCDPNPQLTEHNDLKQVNETDYHYLQRLAERYGARAFVEYNDGKSRFYFVSNRSLLEAKPLGRLEYCRGLNKLIEFKYSSVAARSAKQYVATAVDPVTRRGQDGAGRPGDRPARRADGRRAAGRARRRRRRRPGSPPTPTSPSASSSPTRPGCSGCAARAAPSARSCCAPRAR